MNENEKNYYFSIVKFCCILILIMYFVISSQKSLHAVSLEWFLLAVTMAAALGFELSDEPFGYVRPDLSKRSDIKAWIKAGLLKRRFFLLGMEILLTVLLIIFFRENGIGMFLIPFAVLDTVVFFRLSFVTGLLSLLGAFINPANLFIYLIYCMLIFIIYYQNFLIIEKYRKYLGDSERKEYQLKDSIDSQSALYKEQMEKSSLSYENRMLEEKARLSQALHDKLGHSINGSVFQLEACKVLMDKEPEESKKIIQAVIDNLRSSMDEIRSILRREKPDKKRLAYLQLVQLCTDCKEKYGIEAEVAIEGEDKEIPEALWEVILDNTIEAVTNALKYANCNKLRIEIRILHKVIRCSIQDNGSGCVSIKEGMGIAGMKNRIRKVNGYIDFNSDNGFHINMIIPYE